MSHFNFVEVAVTVPLNTTFTYRLPSQYAARAQIGMRVLVPFGKRSLTGYITGFSENASIQDVKLIEDLLDDEPLFGEDDLRFYQWVSQYYYYPLGMTIKTALPSGINTEYKQTVSLTPLGREFLAADSKQAQQSLILKSLDRQGEVTLRKLQDSVGKYHFFYHISRLKKKGYIALHLHKSRAAAKPKTQKVFSIKNSGLEQKLKGRQKEVYVFLQEKGKSPLEKIKKQFTNCSTILQALEKKGFIQVEEKEVFRRPQADEETFIEPIHNATKEQKEIIKTIQKGIASEKFFPFLLYGVTGSGKTEIYLQVMQEILQRGRQCLFLVPEISLTSQLSDRISSRLNVPLAMLHSDLSRSERYDAWRMIRKGKVKIVIGARSAIFASFESLGVIIVDEEHDPSYKQEEKLRYNARDLALIKGKIFQSTVILGSATPSLESYTNALKKKYYSGFLTKRVEQRALPHVKIIDMKTGNKASKKYSSVISPSLQDAIARRLRDGQQCLLFLNRRGFSTTVICQQCGYSFRCLNCDVSLIHHQRKKILCCHYCNYTTAFPEECPQCKGYFLLPLGWGTERLESEIKMLFPDARTARMDRDALTSKGASKKILKGLFHGEIDMLIGTQMVVKGHHFPNVTLVGVLCADQSLNFPDFRACERTFQLLTQVAGRAGRGNAPGEVIIQTYNPEHYTIMCAQKHDYQGFYAREIKYRQELGYPPSKRMINFRLESSSRTRAQSCAKKLGESSRALLVRLNLSETVDILGPASAPWGKIKGKYRHQMLMRSERMDALRLAAAKTLENIQKSSRGSGVTVMVDVDPLFVL